MVKYKQTNITAKRGVNFVRSPVEQEGCLFHKIEQENDLGIDALIELIKDEHPLNNKLEPRSDLDHHITMKARKNVCFRWALIKTIGQVTLFR